MHHTKWIARLSKFVQEINVGFAGHYTKSHKQRANIRGDRFNV
jgi:hypothetical protein